MHRRFVLSSLGLAATATLAGCLGGGSPPTAGNSDDGDGDSDGGTPHTDTDDTASGGSGGGTHPRFTETSLTATGRCDSHGTASVDFDDGVTVVGCARGRNGCAVPVLGDVSYAVSEDTLTVVVASEVERDEGQLCTEALLPLGYEVRVVMDGTVPADVRVVHDDVDGRREVARASRPEA
jgi:hypothetical protein